MQLSAHTWRDFLKGVSKPRVFFRVPSEKNSILIYSEFIEINELLRLYKFFIINTITKFTNYTKF